MTGVLKEEEIKMRETHMESHVKTAEEIHKQVRKGDLQDKPALLIS